MEKKEMKYVEVKEARRIFYDSENYTAKQLVGYYRLIKDLIQKYGYLDVKFRVKDNLEFDDKSELISELEANINKLCDNCCDVIQLRYFKGYSLRKTAEELSCTVGAVSARRARALHSLYLARKNDESIKKKLIIKNEKIEKKTKFLEDIKSGIIPDFDVELEYFEFYSNLNKKCRNILMRNNVSTILEFLSLKKEEIEKFRNVGVITTQRFLELQEGILKGELK